MRSKKNIYIQVITIICFLIAAFICNVSPVRAALSGGNDVSVSSNTSYNMCENVSDPACASCVGEGYDHAWTALGCISTDPKEFTVDFLRIAIGLAGGIALLLMSYGAFLVSISAGDPKKADEGKEVITGTVAGLLFIIFSVILLNIIGVQILKIPGL